MATRTRNQRKSTTAKKTAAKKTSRKPAAPEPRPATVVDSRPPLAVRRRPFVGPRKPADLAEIRAALASAKAALPVPVSAWHGPLAHLADGTILRHHPVHATTDQTPTFFARIPCPGGAVHEYLIHSATDLTAARAAAKACTVSHAGPRPRPSRVMELREGIRRAGATKADTQPLSLADIADGLTARVGEDQPKEHPQP